MSQRAHNSRAFHEYGFSLIEVVIAIGLCTFALLTIFSLLSIGAVAIQNATIQVTETEIFNRLWSQFNTTPFNSLQNGTAGVSPLFSSPTSAIYFYYDQEGEDITPIGVNTTAPGATVYSARCILANSQTNSSLEPTVPVVNGLNIPGPSLTFIQVQIGFHFDPANLARGISDPRVSTRTFLIAKRDTWNGL